MPHPIPSPVPVTEAARLREKRAWLHAVREDDLRSTHPAHQTQARRLAERIAEIDAQLGSGT